jgi:DNA polymerase I-like protein with 3'-5' exonuclease and polymerase domains
MDLNDNAERALRMVRESYDLSYDTEGSGLDWKTNSPTGYVIGAPRSDGSIAIEDVVYVPTRHGGGGNLPGGVPLQTPTDRIQPHPWETALAKAFDDRNRMGAAFGRVVGHHTKFDAHFSANVGVMLGRRMACTQNQEAMLDEYARSYSLEECAKRHGVTAKKGDELYAHLARQFGGPAERSSMQFFWKTAGNDPVAVDYACGDAVSTWELYKSQAPQIDAEEMRLVADMENDLIWTIFRMERKGIRVDLNRVDELRFSVEQTIAKLLLDFPVGFNTRSPLMVKKAMEDAGFTDWPKTEKGAPSFTEKWLKNNPRGRQIIEIRQMSNLINTFVNPLAERHVFKGRVHATLNQLKSDDKGTISGRFSCNDPNLQQVPKRNKAVAKPFRRLFVPDEGKVFWERDYSQCEPRLFAHYSQDPNLLSNYNAQPFIDVHQTVADLLGVERDPTAKRMNMGIFTGMQTRAFADHMGWDFQRANQAWNQWYASFPRIKAFQDNAKARLLQRGYVYSVLKRRQRLEDRRFAYRGTSKIIQSSNADIVKMKLLEADRACEDNGDIVQILMTVHDSFNGQHDGTPESKALLDQIVHGMEQVQCEPYNLTVPFVMEGTEGGDWCEATWGA